MKKCICMALQYNHLLERFSENMKETFQLEVTNSAARKV